MSPFSPWQRVSLVAVSIIAWVAIFYIVGAALAWAIPQ